MCLGVEQIGADVPEHIAVRFCVTTCRVKPPFLTVKHQMAIP